MSSETNVTNEPPKEEAKSNDKEFNFSQLRKQLESERNERLKAQKQIDELEKRLSPTGTADDDEEISDEPYVDERRLAKKFSKFEQRFEKKIEEKAHAQARTLLEQERQYAFLKENPDFQEILQPEMIQKFATKYPQIAENMLELPDGFARQKLLYQNIKALGLHQPPKQEPSIQSKIDQNRRSPYYQPSSVSTAPYSGGGDFSSAGQKNAYDKMQELKRNLRI